MPSHLAGKLQAELEGYLGRALREKEVRHCEECAINFKSDVPLRYLEALKKVRPSAKKWALFYFPLMAMARVMPGIMRRKDLIFIRGRMRRIYDQCCARVGDGFSEQDLAAILFLARDCTDREIEVALGIARTYGLKTISHVQGIILRNRACAVLPLLDKIQINGTVRSSATIRRWAASRYPDVSLLRELYRGRVGKAVERGKPLAFVVDELTYNES